MAATALAEKNVFSREEYLEMEELALEKSEYYHGKIFSMAGNSRNHSIICFNLNRRIGEKLDDKNCTGFDSNMKVEIEKAESFVYPDLSVVCGDIEFPENRNDTILNPILIIEVLSPSTESFDRGDKFSYYRSLPPLREYVLVSQTRQRVETFFRKNENEWVYTVFEDPEKTVSLLSLEAGILLEDIYMKVDWSVGRLVG